jgi:hypothetical protein
MRYVIRQSIWAASALAHLRTCCIASEFGIAHVPFRHQQLLGAQVNLQIDRAKLCLGIAGRLFKWPRFEASISRFENIAVMVTMIVVKRIFRGSLALK